MNTPTPSPHGHSRSSDLKPERVNKPTCLSSKRPYVREWRNIKNMSLIAPTSNENKSTIPYPSCIFFNFAGNSLHWWLESCISTIAWCRQTFKRHKTRRAYAVIGCHLRCTEINLCLLYRIRVKPHRRFNMIFPNCHQNDMKWVILFAISLHIVIDKRTQEFHCCHIIW